MDVNTFSVSGNSVTLRLFNTDTGDESTVLLWAIKGGMFRVTISDTEVDRYRLEGVLDQLEPGS